MRDVADQRVNVKPSTMRADLIRAKPKNRDSGSLFQVTHEMAKQTMRPKRTDAVSKRERYEPVPGELQQKLPPCLWQLTIHREDTLLPSSNVLATRQRTNLISALKTPLFVSALSILKDTQGSPGRARRVAGRESGQLVARTDLPAS